MHRQHECLAGAEVVLDHAPRHARLLGDLVGAGAVEALVEDARDRGVDDPARVDSSLMASPRAAAARAGGAERSGIDASTDRVLGLERERVGERQAVAAPIEVEHLRDRAGRRDVVDQRAGERQELIVGHDVVDEPDSQRLVGIDEVPGDRELGRLAHAHGAWQQRGQPPRGDDVEARVRVGEARPLRRHDERAAQRELERTGDARAVDRAHHRRGRSPERRARVRRRGRPACRPPPP